MGVWGLAAGLAAALAISVGVRAEAAVVRVDSGEVSGVTAGQVEAFKGIPFAAPPVGGLRWRPPQPAAHWTGVRAATAFGPICMQPQRPGAATPMSEDCLTLNVWRPAGARAGQRLPVMVWIYGGAFIYGSGSVPIYDGTRFAEDGVILVTFNYRLGRFGFFAHPALDKGPGPVGDYGLMDQIAALQWVKRNIAAFGGDPGAVTIFGESAGAISVNYLMGSPAARGLFARAISESGFGRLVPTPLTGPRSAESFGAAYAEAHDIKGDGAAAAAALRALPASVLNAAPGGLSDPAKPGPMLDGRIITQSIAEAFDQGDEAHVPYLEGGNSYEASLFPRVADDPGPVIASVGPPARVMAIFGGGQPAQLAREITTDRLITEPDRHLARDMARQGLAAFVYHFAYVPAAMRATSFGAPHGGEIMYVFDNLPDRPLTFGTRTIAAATPADRKIAAAMHAYWVAFAKTGSPDAAGGPAWPRYTVAADPTMDFSDGGVAVARHFERARLDLIDSAANRPLALH